MASLWVEMKCPEHGLERFKIKIVRKFNMKPEEIIPKYRRRPTVGDLGCLLVGRNVSDRKIENYLAEYFRRRGIMELILKMKLIV